MLIYIVAVVVTISNLVVGLLLVVIIISHAHLHRRRRRHRLPSVDDSRCSSTSIRGFVIITVVKAVSMFGIERVRVQIPV